MEEEKAAAGGREEEGGVREVGAGGGAGGGVWTMDGGAGGAWWSGGRRRWWCVVEWWQEAMRAPPRRPGHGGGRSWRRKGEGERYVPGPKGDRGCLRISTPLDQICPYCTFALLFSSFGSSRSLSSLASPSGYFLSSHISPFFLLFFSLD